MEVDAPAVGAVTDRAGDLLPDRGLVQGELDAVFSRVNGKLVNFLAIVPINYHRLEFAGGRPMSH